MVLQLDSSKYAGQLCTASKAVSQQAEYTVTPKANSVTHSCVPREQ